MSSGFRKFATVIAVLTSTLCGLLLLAPEFILLLFDLQQADSASVICRRAAMLFAGYAVMMWTVLTAPHSAARQSILAGIASMMLGLACAGVGEFLRGAANWPIVLSSAGETAWAVWATRLYVKYSKLRKEE